MNNVICSTRHTLLQSTGMLQVKCTTYSQKKRIYLASSLTWSPDTNAHAEKRISMASASILDNLLGRRRQDGPWCRLVYVVGQ